MRNYTHIPFPKTDAERVAFRQQVLNEVLTNHSANQALLSDLAKPFTHEQPLINSLHENHSTPSNPSCGELEANRQ